MNDEVQRLQTEIARLRTVIDAYAHSSAAAAREITDLRRRIDQLERDSQCRTA